MQLQYRIALAVCLGLSGFSALAGDLINDPFTDGSRSNTTGGDALGGVWRQSTVNTSPSQISVVDDSGGIGTGNAMQLVPNIDFHKLLTFFPTTTLAIANDTISVSFDYRFPTAPANVGGGFRVGLANSNGTKQSGDGGGTTRTDDLNYGFDTNPGSTTTNGTGVRYEPAGDDILGGNGAGARIIFGTNGGSVASGTTNHSALLQITRQANGDLVVSAQIDNLSVATGTHTAASVLTYTFDEFAFGLAVTGNRPTILLDNLRVQTTTVNVLNIAATSPNAAEANLVPATFTVTRTNATDALSLPYNVGGTATNGLDYQMLNGMVNFAAGETTATIMVTPLADYFLEGSETVIVTLTQPPGTLLQTNTATATIADDPSATTINDQQFFAALDMTRQGLAAVQSAVSANDYAAAKSALAAYYRSRTIPVFPAANITPGTTKINNALSHTYTVVGVTYTFPPPVSTINWSYNPTSPLNNEWVWQFNRHEWWDDLAQAGVNDTGGNGNAYIDELFFELSDWITNSPIPGTGYNSLGTSRWRTLDTGIRMQEAWPYAFYRLKSSTRLSDELLILWVKSFYMQAKHLQAHPTADGNWRSNEAQGLFNVGALFPEFGEAATWCSLAISRAADVLTNDVFADGAENELAPTYHDLVVSNVEGIKLVAVWNGLPTSTVFDQQLQLLYNYELYASEPSRNIPRISDSTNDLNVAGRLSNAFAAYPARTDFQWLATNGASGTQPAQTSCLFADAGQVVMRSGWTKGDNYLLMDAGPYGAAHQHEDKLSINVDGYGVRHIIDCGPYNYDTSAYRTASLSSHANSQPLIDDLDQNRAAHPAIWTTPSAITWHTSTRYDYASASYGADTSEGWGPSIVRPAITTRHIFFMKPDVWVVIDAFKALDANAHTYSALFNGSDDNVETDPATQRVTVQLLPGEFDPFSLTTVAVAKPSLTITPLMAGGQTLQIIKGQDAPNPILGWQYYISDPTPKRSIPTARYDRSVTGDTQMAYVLAAAPAASAPRMPTLTTVATAPGTFGVKVSFGQPNDTQTFLIGLDGASTSWQGLSYSAPALIATASGVFIANESDSTFPSISAPPGGFTPTTFTTGLDGTITLPDYTAQAVASDNVGVVSIAQSPAAGRADARITQVTVTAFDAAGNGASVSIDVTVNDVTPPTIAGPFQPLALFAGTGGTALLPDYTGQAVTTDNVGVDSVTQSPLPGTVASLGTMHVTLTAHDAAGNAASTGFDVTVSRDMALVSDPFTDGSRSNTIGGDPLGAAWYQNTTTASTVTTVDDSAGLGTGLAMQLTPTIDFHRVLTFFPATTLASPGDAIRVTFDYRFPAAPASQGDGFRLGLANSAGTRQTSDTNGTTRNDDKNYGFNTNAGSSTGTGTGVKYEDAGDDILGGSGPGARNSFGTSGGSVLSGTTKHSALLQITRQANGDLVVTAQIDNLAPATGTHPEASVLTYTFDEFAFGFGGTGYRPTILMDNVSVRAIAFDITPPVIALAGSNAISIPAETTYTDSGAMATDNFDGNVNVTSSGSVNTQQIGAYTITYTATDAAGNTGTATRVVTVTSTPHYAWRQSIFGVDANNPAISGDLVDPNRNGLVNLLEYALGGDPLGNATDQTVMPVPGRDANSHLSLSFSRFASCSDLTLTVQGGDSPDGPWTDLARSTGAAAFIALQPGVAVSESGTGDEHAVTISDSYSTTDPSHPRRFLRLVAEH